MFALKEVGIDFLCGLCFDSQTTETIIYPVKAVRCSGESFGTREGRKELVEVLVAEPELFQYDFATPFAIVRRGMEGGSTFGVQASWVEMDVLCAVHGARSHKLHQRSIATTDILLPVEALALHTSLLRNNLGAYAPFSLRRMIFRSRVL